MHSFPFWRNIRQLPTEKVRLWISVTRQTRTDWTLHMDSTRLHAILFFPLLVWKSLEGERCIPIPRSGFCYSVQLELWVAAEIVEAVVNFFIIPRANESSPVLTSFFHFASKCRMIDTFWGLSSFISFQGTNHPDPTCHRAGLGCATMQCAGWTLGFNTSLWIVVWRSMMQVVWCISIRVQSPSIHYRQGN